MRIGLVGFVLVCALSMAASATAAPSSRYTSIENKDCKFAPIGNQPGDADDQVKTCPGLGGARVVVNAFHTRLRIGFAWPGKPKVSPVPIVAEAWSAGEKVEWRGTADGKGFVPYAATVRMLFPDEGSAKARYSVLAVMRVKRGEACLVGAVDVGANKDAYDLARALADAAPSFVCGKDKPRIAGAETEWAKMIVADKR